MQANSMKRFNKNGVKSGSMTILPGNTDDEEVSLHQSSYLKLKNSRSNIKNLLAFQKQLHTSSTSTLNPQMMLENTTPWQMARQQQSTL